MLKIHHSISEINSVQWNTLVQHKYPFLQHDFLHALEKHKTIGDQSGWQACYLAYYEEDQLHGALPLFIKYNSWGEFVFDHSWADAYAQFGLSYYPKMVNAVPFTPATGPRILTLTENKDRIIHQLISAAIHIAKNNHISGIHCLFPDNTDFDALKPQFSLTRYDCQYHWQNQNYQLFDDFLQRLKPKKRKNIRQERRKALASGLQIERLNGLTATASDWQQFAALFAAIYERKHGAPAFNAEFFINIAENMPEQIHLCCAKQDDTMVAGALMYSDENTLYGRHWGCHQIIDCLHFELCYYQGIELCIEQKLNYFDPGAQGPHKMARGFLPTLTRSLHHLQDDILKNAINDFCQRERAAVIEYMRECQQHNPYIQQDHHPDLPSE